MTAPAIDLSNYRPSAEEVERNMNGVTKRRLGDAINIVRRSPDHRVLTRVDLKPFRVEPPPGSKLKRGMFLDVETTGLDVMHDKIIEMACVPFGYTTSGLIYEVQAGYLGRESPGEPLREEIVKLTGITDADLDGKKLDDEVILDVAAKTDLFIAHNSDFDRKQVERRFKDTVFCDRPWACSQVDVPWLDLHGVRSPKLDYLLMAVAHAFHGTHGALPDSIAALHLLRTAAPDGRTHFEHLLDAARTTRLRMWATSAPFETKDELKRRGYRWNDGNDGRLKAWWKDIDAATEEEERRWLQREARCNRPTVFKCSAYDRYSIRV